MTRTNKLSIYKHHSIICIFLLAVVLLLFTGCSKKEPVSRTGMFFDTYITITLYDRDDSENLLDACFDMADHYDNLFSQGKEGSDIWNLNHRSTDSVSVSEETAQLINIALSYCGSSNGLIDITIEPVASLWNFSTEGEASHHIPSAEQIEALLPSIDYTRVSVQGNTVFFNNKDTQVSLGFIAKGYIADKLKDYLVSQGVEHALINLGGNIQTIGNKPDGSPFHIGIQKPFDKQGISITAIDVTNKSLVSSGIYERFFEENGKIYHHILNPQTGFPVENNLLGVTILSPSSTEADALSTTCFILGLDDGMKLIDSTEDTEAVFITSDYKLHYSQGLQP